MDWNARIQRLKTLFSPNSVAVIGATQDPHRIGGRPIQYTLEAGYQGRIYPVNPKYDEVQGLKCYPDLASIPERVELAIIAIPGRFVLEAVEQCAAAGVGSVIIFSAGFAEVDEEGRAAQERIREIARRSGMNVLGPNCLGVLSYGPRLMASFTSMLESGNVQAGGIGFATQSGAFGSYFLALARARGMTFSLWVATGNEADVTTADCMAYMALDPATRVIVGYVEGVQDGRRFRHALRLARQQGKPVVLFKAGRSEIGARAAVSHTASMTGNDAVFDAVLRRYGAYRARDVDELLNVAEACSYGALPRGRRLCVVTASGGVGVMMADRAEEVGLTLPPVPDDVQARMRARLPYAAAMNPVDVTAQAVNEPDLLAEYLRLIVPTGRYDAVLTFLGHTTLAPSIAERLLEPYIEIARNSGIPFFLCGIATPEFEGRLRANGIPILSSPSQAVDTIQALAWLHEALQAPVPDAGEAAVEQPRAWAEAVSGVLSTAGAANGGDALVLGEGSGRQLLQALEIPVPRGATATTEEEAVQIAAEIGYPVVLKVDSPDIGHKSDVGGVQVGIRDEQALRQAYRSILDSVRRNRPSARIDGVMVVRMAEEGMEVIVGIQRDPVFGPVVMFGMGGIYAEVFRDTQVALCPVSPEEARELILRTRIGRILAGARGQEPYDLDALSQLVARLSRWAAAEPRLAEVDLNPVRVHRQGKGVTALDALIVLRPAGMRPEGGEP